MTLCGLGKGTWTRIKSLATREGDVPDHGLVGSKAANRKGEADDQVNDLHAHFQELKKLSDIQATRFVRECTGLFTERNNNDKYIYLPPSMGKRHCYGHYSLARGYIMETNIKGNVRFIEVPNFQGTWKETTEVINS
eukprot:scaffold12615_cov57-Attheya_sp.AAC.3